MVSSSTLEGKGGVVGVEGEEEVPAVLSPDNVLACSGCLHLGLEEERVHRKVGQLLREPAEDLEMHFLFLGLPEVWAVTTEGI